MSALSLCVRSGLSRWCLCVTAMVCLWPPSSMAQAARKTCALEANRAALGKVSNSVFSRPLSSEHCGSMVSVLKLLSGSAVTGGRRLEQGQATSPAAAQAELAAARAEDEFKKTLARELEGESDPSRRLLIEAATLHEFGHFKARDLLLDQLRAAAS